MSDMGRAVGRISALAAFAVAMWAGEVSAEAPEIRFARQFSMGYLQFNAMEREQQLEKPASWKDLFFPEIHHLAGS